MSQKRLEGSWHTYTTTTTNTYAGAGGSLSHSAASTHNSWYNGSSTTASSTSYSYVWWDEARVSSSTHDSNTSSGSNPLFTSTYTYNGLGRLASVYIADGRPRTRNPGARIQNEVYLRTANGRRAIDPLTGQARRLDSVVIRDGAIIDAVEVTSTTANKAAQIAKEMRIRQSGGTFVRDRVTGALIDISQVMTRVLRVP